MTTITRVAVQTEGRQAFAGLSRSPDSPGTARIGFSPRAAFASAFRRNTRGVSRVSAGLEALDSDVGHLNDFGLDDSGDARQRKHRKVRSYVLVRKVGAGMFVFGTLAEGAVKLATMAIPTISGELELGKAWMLLGDVAAAGVLLNLTANYVQTSHFSDYIHTGFGGKRMSRKRKAWISAKGSWHDTFVKPMVKLGEEWFLLKHSIRTWMWSLHSMRDKGYERRELDPRSPSRH